MRETERKEKRKIERNKIDFERIPVCPNLSFSFHTFSHPSLLCIGYEDKNL